MVLVILTILIKGVFLPKKIWTLIMKSKSYFIKLKKDITNTIPVLEVLSHISFSSSKS